MVSCEITGARASFAQGSSGRVCAIVRLLLETGEWNWPPTLSTDGRRIRDALAPPLPPPTLRRFRGDPGESVSAVDQLERVGMSLGEVEQHLRRHHAEILERHPAPAEEERHRLGADQLLAGVERDATQAE